MIRIQYNPFLYSHPEIRQELINIFEEFLDEQHYILGPGLQLFEQEYARYNDVKYSVGVGNGHDALLIILKSLEIGEGDEVIIPAHTFIATALSVVNAGATPILVDIDQSTFNIDPDLIESRISERTKAIVPVHMYGNPCDLSRIKSIANKYSIHMIEDNAQAQGAKIGATKTGSLGIMNLASFYPTKNIGALGDAGIITTNSEDLCARAQEIRNYGRSTDGSVSYLRMGINSRMDELQARLLSVKLNYLDNWNSERLEIASWYYNKLSNMQEVKLQTIRKDDLSTHHIFPILTKKRNRLRKHLLDSGIETLVHYEVPIHLHPNMSFLNLKAGSFPISEKLCLTELSLPIYPGLTIQSINFICDKIKSFFINN